MNFRRKIAVSSGALLATLTLLTACNSQEASDKQQPRAELAEQPRASDQQAEQDAKQKAAQSAAEPASAAPPPQAQSATSETQVERFGAPISAGVATPISKILAAPRQFAGAELLVSGHVQRACRKKGCWMEISADAATDKPSCRVRFANYGFFVPRDSAGAEARVQGKLSIEEIPASRVAHLKAEGAAFEHELPDGSALEVQLIAEGVELMR